jgi:hypothetical protein
LSRASHRYASWFPWFSPLQDRRLDFGLAAGLATDIPRIPGESSVIFRLIEARRNEIRSQSC